MRLLPAAALATALATAAAAEVTVDFDVDAGDTTTTAAMTYELRKAVLHEHGLVIRPQAAQLTIHVRSHRSGGVYDAGLPVHGFVGWVTAELAGVEARRIHTVRAFDGVATEVSGFLADTAAELNAAGWLDADAGVHLEVGPPGTIDPLRAHLAAQGIRVAAAAPTWVRVQVSQLAQHPETMVVVLAGTTGSGTGKADPAAALVAAPVTHHHSDDGGFARVARTLVAQLVRAAPRQAPAVAAGAGEPVGAP